VPPAGTATDAMPTAPAMAAASAPVPLEPQAPPRTASPEQGLRTPSLEAASRHRLAAHSQAFSPQVDVQSPAELRPVHFMSHLVQQAGSPAREDGGPVDPLMPVATLHGLPASPLAESRPPVPNGFSAQGSGDGWQGTPRAPSGLFEAPTRAAAAPRAEVRIGTIALEVRTAPPASVTTAAPAPAAAPRPAPTSQFSPRRHYLRWS
jgi:hypothetical protein